MVQTSEHPLLATMIGKLGAALGPRLGSVLLYGSAARGEFQPTTSDLNLLVVVDAFDLALLEALSGPLAFWAKQGQPRPHLFDRALIAASADVFPLEFLDIRRFHTVLHGVDPLADLVIHADHLRLQCERELREKLMRLREGYVECHARERELERLLTDSYTTFVALFRGCLFLLGGSVPARNDEAVAAFCARAGLDPAPFEEVDRLKRAAGQPADTKLLFSRYYAALAAAVARVDRFEPEGGSR